MPIPVVLFTYKRPDHARATLAALALNTLAAQTDLFVFSDGPKSELDAAAVTSVRDVVRASAGFASVTLIERPTNMGLAHSVITGVTELFERYDRLIVLEDDLLTSRHFLAYMNEALDHYCDDLLAFSVTGHTFPEPFLRIPKDYGFDTYSGYRCSSWSWGTWRNRWQRIDWSMDYFPSLCQNTAARDEFKQGGSDLLTMLRLQHDGKIDSWAIRFCYAHHAHDMRCVYPTKTLVRNIGLDNSGTHSTPEPRFSHETLDETWRPQRFCPAGQVDPRIIKSFRSVFESSPPAETSTLRIAARKAKSLTRLIAHYCCAVFRRIKRVIFPTVQDADILVVNTLQKDGGAARAAWRTYLAIRRSHPGALYLTLLKEDHRADIVGHYRWSLKGLLAMRLASLDRIAMRRYPKRLAVPFTPAKWSNPLRIPLSRFRPRLIHLHWLAASLLRVEDLGRIKVPVVWTLHDTWALTGGCHYADQCTGYQSQCGRCPQLGSTRENDLSREVWRRKQQAYKSLDLTIVASSRWLADMARKSSLFAGRRIEIIPNGLDTDVYRPLDKAAAKTFLGIDPAHPVLLFGAQPLTAHRKGGDLLVAALAQINIPCTLVTFGDGQLALDALPNVTVRALGTLKEDLELAVAYSVADMLLCPSREDNLPTVVAEAMACGTPCVAFDVGGLPDMISHQVDGWLAKAFDPSDLAAGIRWVATHPAPEKLQLAARKKALSEYSLEVMNTRYAALYSELLGETRQ